MRKFGGSLARNIDFEVANFQLLVKLVGKRWILSYNLSKLKEVSHKMLALVLSRVSLRVFGFAGSIGGKLQKLTFEKVSKCQNWRKSGTKCSF